MRNLRIDELKQIAGGGDCVTGEPSKDGPWGNNGWGNGAEGTNPGSCHGLTAPSKEDEADAPEFPGTPNNNPIHDER